MSTKTSIKRIALVAVSALGFGLLSVVPAKAFTSFYVHANSAVSGVVKCSQTMTSNSSTTITAGGGTCLSSANIGQGVWTPEDGFMGTIETVTTAGGGTVATLSAASPAQAAVQQAFYTGVRAGTSQRTLSGVNASAISSLTVETNAVGLFNLRGAAVTGATTNTARALINGTQIGASDITAIATDVGLLIPFTAPSAAGTYTVTIQTSIAGTYTGTGADTATTTITLVVTAAAADTYGSSTVTTSATAVDTAGVIYASSSALAASAVTFTVSQFDVNGTAYADAKAKAVTVTLSGVGSLTTSALGTSATSYQAWAALTDATRTVELYGTGTAGTATLTFAVNGVNVATKTVKMYGTVATMTVTPVYKVAPDAGRELGDLVAGGSAVTSKTSTLSAPSSTNDPAFAITHKDSVGNIVPVVPSTMTSSNNGVIVSGITASFVDNGTGLYTQGFGVAHVTVSSAPAAKSGDKADITFAYTTATGTTISAPAVAMTVGGDLTKVTLTTDKATYAPGEAMTLTFKGVDAAGNAPWDSQNAIYSLTASKQMQNLPSSRYLIGGTRTSSSLLPVFAPAVSGPVTLNLIENTASLTKYAVTFTVSDSATDAAANAAADAAAEAIDAANAATDAANLAAEAADAATVAAEEARDAADAATAAVEALATEVATLMAALKAQITTLANTVAKIAKKVKKA